MDFAYSSVDRPVVQLSYLISTFPPASFTNEVTFGIPAAGVGVGAGDGVVVGFATVGAGAAGCTVGVGVGAGVVTV